MSNFKKKYYMKGKLNKRDNDYWLHNEFGETIASSWGVSGKKLSIKNCNEIFSSSVVDVEKLASEYAKEANDISAKYGVKVFGDNNSTPFKDGFNKAMELTKDKLFTMEDVDKIFTCGKLYQDSKNKAYSFQNVLNKLRQPTEIEVEIEMDICGDKVYAVPEPKLDEDGCLILTKKKL